MSAEEQPKPRLSLEERKARATLKALESMKELESLDIKMDGEMIHALGMMANKKNKAIGVLITTWIKEKLAEEAEEAEETEEIRYQGYIEKLETALATLMHENAEYRKIHAELIAMNRQQHEHMERLLIAVELKHAAKAAMRLNLLGQGSVGSLLLAAGAIESTSLSNALDSHQHQVRNLWNLTDEQCAKHVESIRFNSVGIDPAGIDSAHVDFESDEDDIDGSCIQQ